MDTPLALQNGGGLLLWILIWGFLVERNLYLHARKTSECLMNINCGSSKKDGQEVAGDIWTKEGKEGLEGDQGSRKASRQASSSGNFSLLWPSAESINQAYLTQGFSHSERRALCLFLVSPRTESTSVTHWGLSSLSRKVRNSGAVSQICSSWSNQRPFAEPWGGLACILN